MKYILLDTNIVIKYPELLGVSIPDTKLVLTSDVIGELRANTRLDPSMIASRSLLIEQAKKDNTIEILESHPIDTNRFSEVLWANYSYVDSSLVETARWLIKSGIETIIATSDYQLHIFADANGIETLADGAIKKIIQNYQPKAPTALTGKIKTFKSKAIQRFIIQVSITSFLGIFASILEKYGQAIYASIPIWSSILFLIITGVSLFMVRERFRLAYGLAEFIFGIVSIVYIFWPEFSFTRVKEMDLDIKIAAGLYVMVRGQDNIVKSLKGTKPGVFLAEKFKLGL